MRITIIIYHSGNSEWLHETVKSSDVYQLLLDSKQRYNGCGYSNPVFKWATRFGTCMCNIRDINQEYKYVSDQRV